MKTNIKYIFLAIVILAIGFSACERLDNVSSIRNVEFVSATAKIILPDDPYALQPTSLMLRFTNFEEQFIKEMEINVNEFLVANGTLLISVDSLIPGIYSILVFAEVPDEVMATTWIYTGNAVNLPIVSQNTELDINTVISRAGALVFKEIFYAGRTLPQGGNYFREQFWEIYNNSEFTVYLDSLGFTILNPMNATATLPQWPPEDGDRYVYADNAVWQIPGSGSCFPLQPGESVVIAQRAINHPAFMQNSVLDLLGAEFETYINNPNIPSNPNVIHMNLVFHRPPINFQWLAPLAGPALVIFRQTGPIDPNNLARAYGTVIDRLRIRRSDVIDAVEAIGNAGLITQKRMPAELDAGAVTVGGLNTGLGAVRRVRDWRPDGTPILWDTNNSTDDFEVVADPQVRRHGSRRPTWNTWHP